MPDNTVLPGTGETFASNLITDGGVANGVKVERIKVGHGASGAYSDAAPGNPFPVGPGYLEVTGTAAATNTDVVNLPDVRPWRWFCLQITGTFSSNVLVQGSNDGTTWTNIPLTLVAAATNPAPVYTPSAAGLWVGQLSAKQLRIRTSAWASGTVNVILELSALPGTPAPSPAGAGALSNDIADTGLGVLSAAVGYHYRGSALLTRDISSSQAHGGDGTGVRSNGPMGYDAVATVYRRLLCDGAGNLLTRPGAAVAATVTAVAASITVVNLLTANTARRGASIYNDSTSYLYIKEGSGSSITTPSYTYKCPPGGLYELPSPIYQGIVTGIWVAANGNALMTERT